jgi:hypothetical protein
MILPHLRHHGSIRFRDAASDLFCIKNVDGIYRNDFPTTFGQFRIERRWAITAAKNTKIKISPRKAKHGDILVIRTPPRHNFLKCKSHRKFFSPTN